MRYHYGPPGRPIADIVWEERLAVSEWSTFDVSRNVDVQNWMALPSPPVNLGWKSLLASQASAVDLVNRTEVVNWPRSNVLPHAHGLILVDSQ